MDLFDISHLTHSSNTSIPSYNEYVQSIKNGNISQQDDLSSAMEKINKIPVLNIGAKSDVLFPIEQQRMITNLLKNSGNNSVTYHEIDGYFGIHQIFFMFSCFYYLLFILFFIFEGHDTFLIDLNNVGRPLKHHLEN